MASKPWFDARRGRWYCKYKPDPTGKWVRKDLGKHPGAWSTSKPPKKPPQVVLDRANQFAEIEYRARHGLAAGPARAKGLAGYLDDYLVTYRTSHDPGSIRQMERHVRTFAAFAARRGITSVQGITRAVCRDFLEERIKVVSHNTVRTERGYLIGVWSRAVEDNLLAANPWTFAKVPGKPAKTATTFWTSGEVTRIAAQCARQWQSDLVLLLAATGIRISTALAMRWDWVDWQRSTITIQEADEVKTTYTHQFSQAAREVLERRFLVSGRSEIVFPNPLRGGGVIGYDTAREAIRKAIKKAGVPHGTAHDLRHTYGRAMFLVGMPANIVQAQMGHSTLAMTQRYSTADSDTVARVVETLDRAHTSDRD